MNGLEGEHDMANMGNFFYINAVFAVSFITSGSFNFWCSDFKQSFSEHHDEVHSGKVFDLSSQLYVDLYRITAHSVS